MTEREVPAVKKINVVMRNQDIDPAYTADKVVVVINALFSTSAVVHALQQGAGAVQVRGCWQTAAGLGPSGCKLSGQVSAFGKRFVNHSALTTDSYWQPGEVVALTCRPTSEALQMASIARHLYVAALLNAPAMASTLAEHAGERLELICTGPGGRANLIDLYAAGYMVDHLMQARPDTWGLSDTALIARSVYLQYLDEPYRCIADSLTAPLLSSASLAAAAQKACEVGRYDIVAEIWNGAVVSTRIGLAMSAARSSHRG